MQTPRAWGFDATALTIYVEPKNQTVMRTNASIEVLREALENVNDDHRYRLTFNRLEQVGRQVHFTIKSAPGIPGARVSASGRNLPCASWHAHGYLFDEIFRLDRSATIWSGGKKITISEGNWQDIRIAGPAYPGMQWMSGTSIL